MIVRIIKAALVGATLFAVPGMAVAGTSTATGAASFNVTNQCSVTGATVNLGTYLTSQTWAHVAAELGLWNNSYTVGTRGQEYLTWGSVNCDAGIPFSLNLRGTSAHPWVPGGLRFTVGGAVLHFNPYVKKIGQTTIPDSPGSPSGAGAYIGQTNAPATAVGTGGPQEIRGSVTYNAAASGNLSSALTATGAFTDTLTYTLNF